LQGSLRETRQTLATRATGQQLEWVLSCEQFTRQGHAKEGLAILDLTELAWRNKKLCPALSYRAEFKFSVKRSG
jgi:hypothetical protein